MLILKDGHLHKHKFICRFCGCEFVANQTEYKNYSDCQVTGLYNIATNESQVKITEKFFCNCPVCNNLVEDVLTTTDVDELKNFRKSWESDKEL